MSKQITETQVVKEARSAINNENAVRITYRSRGKDELTTRVVVPLEIFYPKGSSHRKDRDRTATIIAFCAMRQDCRQFRVDRVRHIEQAIFAASLVDPDDMDREEIIAELEERGKYVNRRSGTVALRNKLIAYRNGIFGEKHDLTMKIYAPEGVRVEVHQEGN